MNEVIHCIYQIFNGKSLVYVGRSIRPQSRLRSIRAKTGNEKLTQKIVLRTSNFSSACETEKAMIKALRPELNKNVVSSLGTFNPTKITREKMRASRLGKKHSAETRAKIGAALSNPSAETREKIRLAVTGIKRSEETRKKIGLISSNRSAETRRKLSVAQTGKLASEETKAKMKVSQIERRRREK